MITANTNVWAHLDYITASFEFVDNCYDFLTGMRTKALQPVKLLKQPVNGRYTDTIVTACGATFSFNLNRPEQKMVLELKGTELARARELGDTDMELLEDIDEFRGKPSRLDYCLNVEPLSFTLIRLAYESGTIDSKALTTEMWDKKAKKSRKGALGENGSTVYVGSRGDVRRYLKIYDKAHEQGKAEIGISGLWTRFEVTCKGKYAQHIMREMLSAPDFTSVGNAIIFDIVDFRAQWWRDLKKVLPESYVMPLARKDTDFELYVEQFVAACRKRLIEHYVLIKDTEQRLANMLNDAGLYEQAKKEWIERGFGVSRGLQNEKTAL